MHTQKRDVTTKSGWKTSICFPPAELMRRSTHY